jgi:bud site selection protein 31
MPRVRTLRTKRAPEGFEDIEPVLEELDQKMREATNEDHEGKRKAETLWPIMRIHHQQSRYIYELFYKKNKISRELYDWLVKEKYCDVNLIAKWRKPGFERLCCLSCIQPKDTKHGTTCICRVPRRKLADGPDTIIECQHCGCRGCASGDGGAVKDGKKKNLKNEEAASSSNAGNSTFPAASSSNPTGGKAIMVRGPLFSAKGLPGDDGDCAPADKEDEEDYDF